MYSHTRIPSGKKSLRDLETQRIGKRILRDLERLQSLNYLIYCHSNLIHVVDLIDPPEKGVNIVHTIVLEPKPSHEI